MFFISFFPFLSPFFPVRPHTLILGSRVPVELESSSNTLSYLPEFQTYVAITFIAAIPGMQKRKKASTLRRFLYSQRRERKPQYRVFLKKVLHKREEKMQVKMKMT